MTRQVSRRVLLTGAAGVVGLGVGAGGAQLLDGTAPTAAPHVPSPGEELMVEHGVLKRILLAYRTAHDRLAAGRDVPLGALTDAAGVVADYVESFHEGLEEAYVFPRVATAEPQLVRTLLVQHDRGRHLTDRIQAAAGARLTTVTRAALVTDLAAFVRMYEPHEAWEDTVVYPALRRLTPQRTLDQLAERFADLQEKAYGDDGLATVLGRVQGVEQQLGIDDLATFTPGA